MDLCGKRFIIGTVAVWSFLIKMFSHRTEGKPFGRKGGTNKSGKNRHFPPFPLRFSPQTPLPLSPFPPFADFSRIQSVWYNSQCNVALPTAFSPILIGWVVLRAFRAFLGLCPLPPFWLIFVLFSVYFLNKMEISSVQQQAICPIKQSMQGLFHE